MHTQQRKEYSRNLGRDMEYKIFGKAGKICLAFPPQNGRFFDFENFGMVDALASKIEAGKIQLVCVDGIDAETWSNTERSPRERIELHEAWFNYVLDELVPRVRAESSTPNALLMTTGCSMGAFHAANFFFRAPQIFDTVIALSGLYHAGFFFGNYSDELVYLNSPIDCLPNMPENHAFMPLFRRSQMIFCVGQGAWEDELLESTRRLDAVFRSKNIPAWFDYWGHDVNHDWDWWRKQIRYFIEKISL